MDDMHTQFIDLAQGAWAVYRVRTVSGSVYLVGLHSIGGRRAAVVRGEPGTDKENVIVRDTDPQVGSSSLFDAPSSEWPGQRLRVATMETSPIESATLVTDQRTVTAVTGVVIVHPAGRSGAMTSVGTRREAAEPPPMRRTPYPESHVRYAEDAAALLREVQRRGDLLAVDLDAEPQLLARMHVALAGCVLSLEELETRFRRG